MIAHWLLLLLLVPGWLLPSGVRVPLCGCQFAETQTGSCCASLEDHTCCSRDDAPEPEGIRVERGGECHCSVDAPEREPARTHPDVLVSTLHAVTFEPAQVALAIHAPAPDRAIRRDRPRGPSPGRPNPAPLRL